MSGLPHPFDAPPGNDYVLRGNEIKPVTHTTEWCEDGVATVRWCGSKYLFNAELVLNPGETKPCPVCGMELHHDEKKKGVVEFPKLSLTEPGGQMNVREALETLLFQEIYHSDGYDDDARLLAPKIEKAARATYWEGVHDAQYAEIHPNDKYAKLDDQEGVIAFVAAMTEGP